MAFADDLIEPANHLARKEGRKPKQASLRRAVSAAYYALFHLLIADAVANWKRSNQRAALARIFEHGRMKTASENVNRARFDGQSQRVVADLKVVADAFVRLQQDRHAADYDNARKWSRNEVLDQIDLASKAFRLWRVIREEPVAQDYLLSLLTGRR